MLNVFLEICREQRNLFPTSLKCDFFFKECLKFCLGIIPSRLVLAHRSQSNGATRCSMALFCRRMKRVARAFKVKSAAQNLFVVEGPWNNTTCSSRSGSVVVQLGTLHLHTPRDILVAITLMQCFPNCFLGEHFWL
jgi:hypothetical protein